MRMPLLPEQSFPEEAFLKYGHENITIRDNYVKRSGGDAITVMYALRPVVEHNCSDSAAQEINDRIYREPGSGRKSGGCDLAVEM